MDETLYLAFLAATTVMILLPGPSVMLTVAHALRHGWRRALMTVAGATLGFGVQLAITLAGMASFMLVLAQWFEWLRWAGVAYLIYLGIRHWRAKPEAAGAAAGDGRSLFLQGLVVTIPNPKKPPVPGGVLSPVHRPGRLPRPAGLHHGAHIPRHHLRLHRRVGGGGGAGRTLLLVQPGGPDRQPDQRRPDDRRRTGVGAGAAGVRRKAIDRWMT